MDRLDAHCHFWQPARGDYGWLDTGGPELDPLRREFLPPDLASLNGARRVIAVQAAPSEAETHFLLGLAQTAQQVVGVVGWVDLTQAEATGRLAALARNPRFKGVRPMLQDIADADWIDTAPAPEAIAALVRLGLRFDALVKTRHLPALLRFCARYPELPVVIDHAAKPDLLNGISQTWHRDMALLAADGKLHCKLSGLVTEMCPSRLLSVGLAVETLKPVLGRLLDWFGPRRLMWGSDWPVITLAVSHRFWEEVTERLLADLSAADRAEILGGTAVRFYGLEEAVDA
ncbi:amidohydrolase family protein [Pannonibacter carbonis]|uniref:amidohydrolase family protein n=1 Tax=Pannonibacter carbonis TaxID=2067569 RepID=UPI0018E5764E|nr:amidohydrolase family protein [Pannonibacter carbonis]